MIIIVEGVDRVGKTTLCEKLAKVTGYKIFRDDTRYFGNHKDAYINTEKINTLQCLIDNGVVKDIILDRYHFTEFVYGYFDREYCNIAMQDIDKRLSNLGHEVLLLYVKPENVILSSIEHGRNLREHNKLMCKLFNASEIKTKIDLKYRDIDDVVDVVCDIMKDCGVIRNEK